MNRKRPGPPLRFRELSLPDIVEISTLRKTIEDPFPNSALLLRGALKATLDRLHDMKPEEAGFVQMHLKYLASLESLMDEELSQSDQDNLANRITFHLVEIANSPQRGKLAHDIAGIAKQANWLTSRLNQISFQRPDKLRNMASWKAWLRDEIPFMLDLIIVLPCSCQYPAEIDRVIDRIINEAKDNKRCTPAQLVRLVLSALHQSTPSGIDKYLKKTARNNSGLFSSK